MRTKLQSKLRYLQKIRLIGNIFGNFAEKGSLLLLMITNAMHSRVRQDAMWQDAREIGAGWGAAKYSFGKFSRLTATTIPNRSCFCAAGCGPGCYPGRTGGSTLLKKVRKLEFHRSYFSYYHTSNIVFDIIRKPVYLSLNWYHICNGYEIVENTLQLVLIESQKWNLAKHCVLAVVQSHWRMKTIGDSLLSNTNELQDFISDLPSYPAALYIYIP